MNTTLMPILQLQTHPRQAEVYDACSHADDEVLAADLRQNGQREPIIVMPPDNAAGLLAYTILDGHRRAHLLQQLGHTEVRVQIRSDLKDADAATVESAFLMYNFARRQLHPLDKARIGRRLYELELGQRIGRHGSAERDARDRIGKLIGMSGRNLNRYWAVLNTPLAVQRAVRDGRLTLVLGAKVAGLSPEAQAEIAKRIGNSSSKKVSAIVNEYFTVTKNSQKTALRFIKAIDCSGGELRKVLDSVSPNVFASHLMALRSAQGLLNELIDIAEKVPAPRSINEMRAEAASLDFALDN